MRAKDVQSWESKGWWLAHYYACVPDSPDVATALIHLAYPTATPSERADLRAGWDAYQHLRAA